ncbi:MAG: hypothetical protein JJT76_01135 [Clostridiaceae bacterium]|nr:hypothetical protein [Clostridiaceae bacterium]
MNGKLKKVTITLLVSSLTFVSVAYAYNSGIYLSIRDRIKGIENTYLQKSNDLESDRQNAEVDLIQYVEGLENEIISELNSFEEMQLREARNQISAEVQAAIDKMDNDKTALVDEIKVKIQERIDKELEKELKKLEKTLNKK